jgi:hypothetical protein
MQYFLNAQQVLYQDNRVLIPQTTTRNIMDYRQIGDSDDYGRYFFKYQIEHLNK